MQVPMKWGSVGCRCAGEAQWAVRGAGAGLQWQGHCGLHGLQRVGGEMPGQHRVLRRGWGMQQAPGFRPPGPGGRLGMRAGSRGRLGWVSCGSGPLPPISTHLEARSRSARLRARHGSLQAAASPACA